MTPTSTNLSRIWGLVTAAAVIVAVGALFLAAYLRTPPVEPGAAASHPQRIVSLAPSLTEMLFALDLGSQIVGATDWSDYPPEAAKIPHVGGISTVSVERILALSPDLVLAGDFETQATIQALQQSGLHVLTIHTGSVAQVLDALRQIGQATGKQDKARQIVGDFQSQLNAIASRYAVINPANRPHVYAEIWHDPITTAGGGSFLDDVIRRAGGINVAHELSDANPTISPEQVVAWNPDFILLCYHPPSGSAPGNNSELASRIGWKEIRAIHNGQVINDIDPDLIVRPGPRLIRGITALADRLYPRSHGVNGADGINATPSPSPKSETGNQSRRDGMEIPQGSH